MNKYLLLAAVGSVEACPNTDAPKLNSLQLNRLILKNTYQGFVTGFYQENDKVVPDECFGAWTEIPFNNASDLHRKFHEDFWSVGIDEVKTVGNDLIDVFYKNSEVCHTKRVSDDFKHWCIENPAECIFMENMEGRIFDNMFEIAGKIFDIGKLINTNDTCYSDLEQMAEIYRFFNDLGEIAASVSGFDLKWDQSIQRSHIKTKAFHSKIKEAYDKYMYKNVSLFELMFPDLYYLVKEIEKQVDYFFQELEAADQQFEAAGKKFAQSLIPHHHHSKKHHFMPEMKAPELKMPELEMPTFNLFPQPPIYHHHGHMDWSHFKLF